jgi:hypothetical protein
MGLCPHPSPWGGNVKILLLSEIEKRRRGGEVFDLPISEARDLISRKLAIPVIEEARVKSGKRTWRRQ